MSRAAALPALLAALALSLPAAAERTVTIDGRRRVGLFGRAHALRGPDHGPGRGDDHALPPADAKGLVLEGSRNGGVTVRGADVGEFKVTACTAAAGDDDASARAVLSKVVLRSSGGRVTIEGPDGRALDAAS